MHLIFTLRACPLMCMYIRPVFQQLINMFSYSWIAAIFALKILVTMFWTFLWAMQPSTQNFCMNMVQGLQSWRQKKSLKLVGSPSSFILHWTYWFSGGGASPDLTAEAPPIIIEGKPYLPFQVQIEYTRLDGAKCMRVLTEVKPVTYDRETAEKGWVNNISLSCICVNLSSFCRYWFGHFG